MRTNLYTLVEAQISLWLRNNKGLAENTKTIEQIVLEQQKDKIQAAQKAIQEPEKENK